MSIKGIKESEIKIMLSNSQYNDIENIVQSSKINELIQKNYYFDNYRFDLSNNRVTLRIRERDNNYKLTVKVKDNDESDGNFVVSREFDWPLTPDIFDSIMREPQNIIRLFPGLQSKLPENFQNEELRFLGQLTTCRIVFKPVNDLPAVELDKSEYLNNIDFELEWELNDKTEINKAIKWLSSNSIQSGPSTSACSKFGRFTGILKSRT